MNRVAEYFLHGISLLHVNHQTIISELKAFGQTSICIIMQTDKMRDMNEIRLFRSNFPCKLDGIVHKLM